jgi:hypothetical protein
MNPTRQMRRHQERQVRKGRSVAQKTFLAVMGDERLVACALIDHEGITHHGQRSHSQLRADLGRADAYAPDPTDTLGFWTSTGRFVTRDEAKLIGEATGQCHPQQRELLSSDIDW